MRNKILSLGLGVLIILMSSSCFSAEKENVAGFEEKYKDKQYVFLLYDVSIKVNEDFSYVLKTHKKVKILKEEARSLGELSISYEKGRETISAIKAFTITPDNKKHSYSKMQDLKAYDGYPMYSDAMVKLITLPEVVVGSVLEQECTLISKGMPIKNAFWYFDYAGHDMPVKEYKFVITMPKKLGIKYKEFNLTKKPKITEANGNITYAWDIQDMPPTKDDEDYLPPPIPENIEEGFEFSSINDWKDISDWYMSLVKKNLKITPEIKKAVDRATEGKVTLEDKTRAILKYVQENFRYVSMSFGNNTLEPHLTDEIFKNKYGDCKDLSLLTMAMLKSAGIDSQVVLFNTEFSINDPKYDLPVPSLFDHVILLVKPGNGKDFYIDPLLDGYDVGQYPLAYQGAWTFIITDNGGRFDKFPIFGEDKDYTANKLIITIYEDSSALIESEAIWNLDFSIQEREKIKALDKEDKDKFWQAIDGGLASGGEMIERKMQGLEDKYGPIKPITKIKRKDEFPVTDGMIIIDIAGYDRDFDFTRKERKKPIFYTANSMEEETTTYRIPKGFKISHIPDNLNLDIGFFSIKREYAKAKDEIKVTEVTRHKRMQLPKEDYAKIKQFFDQLPAKTQQRIIIKKENSAQF